jgi:hypothetical protein
MEQPGHSRLDRPRRRGAPETMIRLAAWNLLDCPWRGEAPHRPPPSGRMAGDISQRPEGFH